MKKLIIAAFMLLTITINAQSYKIESITPTTWTNTYTTSNTGTHTVIGSTVGYLLTGGLWGIIGGGLIGHSTGGTTTTVTEVHGWLVRLEGGKVFRTTKYYNVNQNVTKEEIKEE